MKQYISEKQINELSGEGKERLGEWWEPVRGDLCVHDYGGVCVITNNHTYELVAGYEPRPGVKVDVQIMKMPKKEFLPLLSIGQMIEFLDEHIDSSISSLAIDRGEHQWHVYALDSIPTKPGIGNGCPFVVPELCDALWEATKKILESETE